MTLGCAAALALAAIPVTRVAGDGEAAKGAVFLREGESVTLAEEGAARWSILDPAPADYDNVTACGPFGPSRGCAAPIRYVERALPALDGRARVDTSDVAELGTPGTHLLLARGVHDTGPATPTDAVQVVVRRDDGYVGRLTELLGVPFVLGPARLPDIGHQTDARLGADCVALVVYGRRRLGEPVPYAAPARLHGWLTKVTAAPALVCPDGSFAELAGVREGDVLHFGFQTAVVSRDRPPLGILDPGDLVIHTYHRLAEERPVGALPYARHPVEVLRWPGVTNARATALQESP
ncbi:MAG: hypothetical protein QM704_25805 [Anaeromyxobacteraceae bacterium]